MSIIASKISVDKSVIVGRIDSPLDARTRCNNTADFPNIETPFIGMIIFTTDDRQYWVVTELQSKLIGSQMIENYQIKSYEKLVDILGAAGGGGAEYSAGGGISISDKNVISVNFNIVAKKSDIVNYTAGDGLQLVGTKFEIDYSKVAKKSDIKSYSGSDNITVGSDGKIDVTDKVALKSDIKTYTAGNGISISDDNEISIKGVRHFDEPQDGFIGLYTDADGLHFTTNLIVTKEELSDYVTNTTFNNTVGDIESALDIINQELTDILN